MKCNCELVNGILFCYHSLRNIPNKDENYLKKRVLADPSKLQEGVMNGKNKI